MKRFPQLLLFSLALPLWAQDSAVSWPAPPAGGKPEATALVFPERLPSYRPEASGWWLVASLAPPSSLDYGIRHSLDPSPALAPGAGFGGPWLRTGVGFVLPGLALKPCIGFQATFPVVVPVADPSLKLPAPRGQLGIYGGIRF